MAEQISSSEEIPDRRARRPVRETPDKGESARYLSDRFHSIRRGLANCKKHRFAVCGETDEAPLARELFLRLAAPSHQI